MVSGWKAWLLLATGALAAGATGFVLVTEVVDPGADVDSSSPRSVQVDGGDEGLVIRALGDSVTAGFGYRNDGMQIGVTDLSYCGTNSADSSCQDPDGVAYPAVFAARQGGSDFENLAESGSTGADWLGEGKALSSTLEDVVEADPDMTVLTIGANPMLQKFLTGGDRFCATTLTATAARTCVQAALVREEVLVRLTRIYATLLATPEDGRNGLVVVFQYPETVPPSALGVRVQLLVEELRSTIEQAAETVREADARKGERLVIADPGPFLEHGCTASEPWILRVDTCIHPNAAGHEQLANVLDGILADRLDPEPPGSGSEEEEYATPGTSCGVTEADAVKTSVPGDRFDSRLGVTRGELACSEIEDLFERYATDTGECERSGAGTCFQQYRGWICVGPTVGAFPRNFSCYREQEVDSGRTEVVGLYAKETTPTVADSHCGDTNEGGGPFEIEANFDCRAARRIARTASSETNYGFLCETEATGIESSRTDCMLDDARVTWINGA